MKNSPQFIYTEIGGAISDKYEVWLFTTLCHLSGLDLYHTCTGGGQICTLFSFGGHTLETLVARCVKLWWPY